MGIDEIREGCLRSEQLQSRLEAFLEARRQKILKWAKGHAYYIMSATPLSYRDGLVNIHSDQLRQLLKNPPEQRAYGWNLDLNDCGTMRPTFDGLSHEIPGYKYIEVFRNGHLECRAAIEGGTFRCGDMTVEEPIDPHNPSSPKQSKSHIILGAVPVLELPVSFLKFVKAYAQLIEPGQVVPWIMMISLINVQRFGLYERSTDLGWGLTRQPSVFLTEEHLECPPYQVSLGQPFDQAARHALDTIWNTFGYERAPYFDDEGRFTVPTQ